MGSSGRYVFRASRDAHVQITELFDFVHPTAIAMWNLRWQVQGFLSNVTNATAADLDGRFARGSELGSGSLRRATVETTWEAQLEQFASVILISVIAAFEDFAASISSVMPVGSEAQRRLSESLQFPASPAQTGRSSWNSLVGRPSQVLSGAVTWDRSIAGRYQAGTLDDLLLCYRFFKEVRNAISHNGRRANPRTVAAFQAFSAACSAGKVGNAPVPDHYPVAAVGEKIRLSYRGVVGFSDIVLRLIATYDHELTKYEVVEHELLARLKPDMNVWPSDPLKITQRMRRLVQSDDFPAVTVTADLRNFLRAKNLVPTYV